MSKFSRPTNGIGAPLGSQLLAPATQNTDRWATFFPVLQNTISGNRHSDTTLKPHAADHHPIETMVFPNMQPALHFDCERQQ